MPVLPLYKSPNAKIKTLRSEIFDLDNGAGTTVDSVMGLFTRPVQLLTARIIYTDATTGTVAAGNAKIGTTVGGAEVVTATAYGNAATVGTKTAMTLLVASVAANTMITARHTGVASTQAGKAYVEIEYAFFDD